MDAKGSAPHTYWTAVYRMECWVLILCHTRGYISSTPGTDRLWVPRRLLLHLYQGYKPEGKAEGACRCKWSGGLCLSTNDSPAQYCAFSIMPVLLDYRILKDVALRSRAAQHTWNVRNHFHSAAEEIHYFERHIRTRSSKIIEHEMEAQFQESLCSL
jgi:hypothetical protein